MTAFLITFIALYMIAFLSTVAGIVVYKEPVQREPTTIKTMLLRALLVGGMLAWAIYLLPPILKG